VAQQVGKVARLGVLDPSTASGSAVLWDAFRQELSKFGWVEGKNIAIEYRFAELKPNHLPVLAAELVRFNVDLIVVPDTPSTLAVKKASTMEATGTESLNGVPGAMIQFILIDDGEPGAGVDIAHYFIQNAAGDVVLDCPMTVLDQGGNHQAHKQNTP
jgi:hypothetical protein